MLALLHTLIMDMNVMVILDFNNFFELFSSQRGMILQHLQKQKTLKMRIGCTWLNLFWINFHLNQAWFWRYIWPLFFSWFPGTKLDFKHSPQSFSKIEVTYSHVKKIMKIPNFRFISTMSVCKRLTTTEIQK